MTLPELKSWIASARHVERESDEYDSNNTASSIYEKDGRFYRIEFMNGHPSEKYGERGYLRGVYEPEPVHRVGHMEYVCEWVND